jgi:hypothetical protein
MAEPVSSDPLLVENSRLKDLLAEESKTIGALQLLLEKARNGAAGESRKNAEILEELGLAKLIVNQSQCESERRGNTQCNLWSTEQLHP